METIYNVEFDEKTVMVTIGDTIDISLIVSKNGVAYDITGMRIDMVIKDFFENIIATLSTVGTSPKITISTTLFSFAPSAFTTGGIFHANVNLTNGSNINAIMKTHFIVEK